MCRRVLRVEFLLSFHFWADLDSSYLNWDTKVAAKTAYIEGFFKNTFFAMCIAWSAKPVLLLVLQHVSFSANLSKWHNFFFFSFLVFNQAFKRGCTIKFI